MSERKKIRNYLDNLDRYLSPLSPSESQEVVREIESHIYDVIDDVEVKGEVANVEDILERLGAPRELALQYVGHIQHGAPPPEGFRAISLVKKGLSRTAYWSMMCFGYGCGAAFIAFAFANLLLPNGIGVWSAADGNTIVIGLLDTPYIIQERQDVIHGFWLSPITLGIGYLMTAMTYKVQKFLRQFFTETSHG